MANHLFLLNLAVLSAVTLNWGFRRLPGRQWQICATVPSYEGTTGSWQGTNLTWYGIITASANLVALLVVFCLLGSVGVPRVAMLMVAGALLVCALPAARWIAWLVEGKQHTFTVGGAVFVGFVTLPWIVVVHNFFAGDFVTGRLSVLAVLAAVSIGYAFGEGLGRLACISYGCCYGKPLQDCGPLVRRVFKRCHFVFRGETKKIAYASGLDGESVVPIQAVTALLYCTTGLLAAALYLHGLFAAAFLVAALVTQAWRVVSEMWRADYRGGRRLSAYQVMGLLLLPYTLLLVWLFPSSLPGVPDMSAGFQSLWHPAVVLALQVGWLTMFLFLGRSQVTGAQLSFYVHQDRI
ncbi:prolipoprotein diacylglyceryl transferase [Syntrophotalea acetylenivorans]|uniref:Prolipoprotein diacylglyceryl transferase n=1 Tax=Syntrophotalea acetylenivorans TaxID=1842532 RepID=A0A1L3GRU9_9BACT|nr:prolipoprotein diacylglyceryl transferase family protein [Syntrophotalea acetylenivorans]APG28676.1 prolipoprotein diacylglyceryl transferase [Syntrophotalea acetylenivorans]